MEIESINCYQLRIPFRTTFSHSSATRTETESLWVEVTSDTGLTGYGESCPRNYVTGETMRSVINWISQHSAAIVHSVHHLQDLVNYEKSKRSDIDRNPAAWCALELALLDLMAKDKKQTVEALIGYPELEGSFRYSAVLGDAAPDKFREQIQQYMSMGFRDYKVKLSGDLARDAAKLCILREFSKDRISIRLDANNLWSNPIEAIEAVASLEVKGVSLEEPLTPNQYQDMATVAAELGAKIILDESFLREDQFDELAVAPGAWMINLRVSKMGGIMRSLQIVKRARQIGVPVIIGAQVGETSLLTRAALTVAGAARDVLNAQEGAFGTYLLCEDICRPMLMFGKEGLLSISAGQNHGYGFGLAIIERRYFQSC